MEDILPATVFIALLLSYLGQLKQVKSFIEVSYADS